MGKLHEKSLKIGDSHQNCVVYKYKIRSFTWFQPAWLWFIYLPKTHRHDHAHQTQRDTFSAKKESNWSCASQKRASAHL